jgi:hypothetical protein
MVREYDMGQTSGSFIFEYNTFAVADHITIYNGNKDQISPDKVIFDRNKITEKTVSEEVVFSNQIITVVVNANTRFKYKVNCPK